MIATKPCIEADLLIVGGGIGGLMAAISAAQSGCKNVVVMEKMHARRSGSGATGNDHVKPPRAYARGFLPWDSGRLPCFRYGMRQH